MATYFTADTHFSHARIQEFCPNRPQGTVEEHNATLIDNWNSVVASNSDDVWVLGDFLMGRFIDGIDQLTGVLNGTLHLIAGNHDRVWGGVDKVHPANAWDHYMSIFTTVQDAAVIDVGWGPWRLSHFPHTGDSHDEDRYLAHRPADDGLPLLHGHVHDAFHIGRSINGTPHVNVGVDVNLYAPISANRVARLLADANSLDHNQQIGCK